MFTEGSLEISKYVHDCDFQEVQERSNQLVKEIRIGEHIGEEFWICDLRYKDFSKKPIRHIEPVLVKVVSESECKSKVYYSNTVFRVVGSKKIIKLFDNTSYRMFAGTPVQIFDEEETCRNHYRVISGRVSEDIQRHLNKETERLTDLINKYK